MKTTITKSQKRLFVVLAIVASYAAYDLVTAEPRNKKTAPENVSETNGNQAQETISAVSNAATVSVSFPLSGWRRDPFRKEKESFSGLSLHKVVESFLTKAPAPMYLTAISQNGARSYALINDQILSVGEKINGYKIVEIGAAKVVLRKNEHSFTLTLPDEE